ncbi:MAG: nucleotidyltransferase domain-containing protein [Methylotenera sp.]|nr:nucleotidyltransferase domain-containing protein [Methylotenera sp.]
MRLAQAEQLAISDTIKKVDIDAAIYLFGSRVDDTAKGGDIDLLVLSKKIDIMAKLDILAQLHHKLGARKIDIALYPDASSPFSRMAMQAGVPL